MWGGSRESSMGWLIWSARPDWCVDTASKPWLRSSTTVGSHLLFTVGWAINLSIKERRLSTPLWEQQLSGDHPDHRLLCYWMSEKGSTKFGGLMEKNLYFMLHGEDFKWRFGNLTVQFQKFYWKIALGPRNFFRVLPDQLLWPDSSTFLRFLARIRKDEALSVMLLLLQLCDEKENAIQNTEVQNPQMQMLLQMKPLPTWREKIQAQIHSLAFILCMRQLTVRPKSNYLGVQKIVNIKFISAPSNFIFRFLHSVS